MAGLSETDKEINSRFIEVYEGLKELRLIRNKGDLSDLIGMPREYFSKFENFKRPIPDKYLEDLSTKFNISLQWLTTGAGKNPFSSELVNNIISGNKIKGSGNAVGINNQAGGMDLQIENEKLKSEMENLRLQIKYKDLAIEQLEQRIKDKEEMIELLKKK